MSGNVQYDALAEADYTIRRRNEGASISEIKEELGKGKRTPTFLMTTKHK
jgi:predicted transcriptional regulator